MVENDFKETDIGAIPEDWNVVNLSDNSVADLIMGQSPSSSTYNQDGVGLPFMQGKAEFGRIYPNPDKWCSLPSRVAEQNDVLMSVRAPVGDVNIAPFKCAIGRGLAAIRAKQKSKSLYLFFYLCFAKKKLEDEGTGSTFKAINKGVLENFKIALPEIDEQKNIIAILSKLQQAIAQQENIIAKTKELKRSLMHRIFTYGLRGEELKETEIGLMPESWVVKRIEDIVEKTSQKDMRKKPDVQFKYIDVSSISNNSFKITGSTNYKGSESPSRARKIVRTNDILFATVRPTLKRIAYVTSEFDREICSTAFCVLRSVSTLSSRYLYYCVQRDSFIESLGKLQRGASYPAITDGNIKDQLIPFPTSEEQKDIADILRAIDNKIDHETAKKDMLQELFKSMLQLLMTGQVRVKDIDFGEACEKDSLRSA